MGASRLQSAERMTWESMSGTEDSRLAQSKSSESTPPMGASRLQSAERMTQESTSGLKVSASPGPSRRSRQLTHVVQQTSVC